MTTVEHEAAFADQVANLTSFTSAVKAAIAVNATAGDAVTQAQVDDLVAKVATLKSLVLWLDTYAEYTIGNMEFDPYGNP